MNPVIQTLLIPDYLMPLGPGVPNETIRPALKSFRLSNVVEESMARACHAGLWLYHNFLDESHTISQEIDTPTGSFWHGILHRREPDAANAAYWFRRVGEHPVFELLGIEAQKLGLTPASARWNPFRFIDWCEECRGTGSGQELLLRTIQRREWELLFDWCFRQALGQG